MKSDSTEKIVNLKDIKLLISKDLIIEEIFNTYGSPPDWVRKPGFVALSKIILGQQVSLESAQAHFDKLNSYLKEFTPENILKLSDEEMRNCYISRQKATYLRNLSESILGKKIDLENLNQKDNDEIKKALTSIKGIGNWTAEVYMLFCLQLKDIFPIGDIAVINTIKELYKISEKEEIIEISDSWRPLRSLGTFFMWHYYLRKGGRTGNF